KGSHCRSTAAMLRDKLYWLGHPYLLYEKVSTNTKLLQTSLERLRIGAEESFHDDVILYRNRLAGVRLRPLFTVLFEHLEFCRERASRCHRGPSKFYSAITFGYKCQIALLRYCVLALSRHNATMRKCSQQQFEP